MLFFLRSILVLSENITILFSMRSRVKTVYSRLRNYILPPSLSPLNLVHGSDKEPFYTTSYNVGCLTFKIKKNKARYLVAQSFLCRKQDAKLATLVEGEFFENQSEHCEITKLNAT